jgi:hypothetical protein
MHAGKTTKAAATRLVVTYNINLQHYSESAREPESNPTTPTRSKLYCTRSPLPGAEPGLLVLYDRHRGLSE